MEGFEKDTFPFSSCCRLELNLLSHFFLGSLFLIPELCTFDFHFTRPSHLLDPPLALEVQELQRKLMSERFKMGFSLGQGPKDSEVGLMPKGAESKSRARIESLRGGMPGHRGGALVLVLGTLGRRGCAIS